MVWKNQFSCCTGDSWLKTAFSFIKAFNSLKLVNTCHRFALFHCSQCSLLQQCCIYSFVVNVIEIAAVEMEHDGVGDVEVDVNLLSDDELSRRLRQLGANIGPITGIIY